MKINKNLRDLLMRQSEAYMISPRELEYLGSHYTFTPVTRKEIDKRIGIVRTELRLDEIVKPWYKKLFK